MKITFLGTGTSMGVPVIACNCSVCTSTNPKDKRGRSAVKVEVNGRVLVIDAGPDFRQQMLESDTRRLDAILFTHEHKDHTGGLDDARVFNWISKTPMPLFAERRVLSALEQEYAYAFNKSREASWPRFTLHEIDEQPFKCFNTEIVPIRAYHHRLPVLGFRIGDFSYVTDASHIPSAGMDRLAGSTVLGINGLRIKEHVAHYNLEQAIEVIKQIAPRKAYITHLSHRMGLHDEVSEALPDGISLAWDGLEVEM